MTFHAPEAASAAQDHWADELPQALWLDAAELDELPYTFIWRPAHEGNTRHASTGGRHAEPL
ncbi:hypothetical protein AB4120_12285 [Cupriavidus sp. 2KB_3]|uniref:hypothetical protein n=1 Tax=Cupriavidus TaxID=106589 RepID=UPI0011EFFCDA|nr:hypothetical protein [Cupriavidus campinensis]